MTGTTRVLAITGASGSGKSTLARHLVDDCNLTTGGEPACLVGLDAYYRDLSHLSMAERERVDFDRPEAIEFPLFQQHLATLRSGASVVAPRYDFTTHTRLKSGSDELGPAGLVVADGLLLGAWDELPEVVDFTVFVETPLDLCLQRRLERDCGERGRTEESVRAFWFSRALPGFERWGAVARRRADLVVSGTLPAPAAVEAIRRTFAL